MATHTQGQHLTRNRGISLLVAVVAALALLITPAAWGATPPAAEPQQHVVSGTWAGQVERHGEKFAYVGLPCTTDAEVCVQIQVTYRIVPITDQAREALPHVVGQRAELEGTRYPSGDERYDGILVVEQVTPIEE